MKRKITISFVTAHLLLLVTLAITPAFAETRYVDATNGDNANSGTAWNQAYKTLAFAIHEAHQTPFIKQIRVAAGIYYPEYKAGNGTSDRHKAFTITRTGLEILGGYPAGGNGARDPDLHPTIMSGNLGELNNSDDNAYHVLITAGSTIDASLKLDGFTIKDGNANGFFYYEPLLIEGSNEIFDFDGGGWYNLLGSPQLNNMKIVSNYAGQTGGGVRNAQGNPTVTNFTLSDNTAGQEGGGWYNSSGNPVLKNGMIQGNTGQYGGGAWANITGNPIVQNCLITNGLNWFEWAEILLNKQGQPSVINCTIVSNGNGYQLIHSEQPNTYISNCIIWGQGAYPENYSENIIFANSIVNRSGGSANWNGPSRSDGGGNLDVDPLFVNPGAGNYRLKRSSPAINTGKNSLITDQSTPDLDGNIRIFGANVDMGAYENNTPVPASGTIYVDASVTTPGIGDSWATAIPSLAEAIGIAHVSHVSIDKILVAEGTYYPEYKAGNGTDEHHKAFTITRAGLEILGGYPASGNGARDPDAHPTVMSGDLGSKGEHFDNAYHVLITAGSTIDASLKLDGFTIKEGNAKNYYGSVIINGLNGISDGDGGGWYNLLGSPQLNNVKIIHNFAYNKGSGVHNVGGNPTVTNFTLSDNMAGEQGGGWYNSSGSPVLKNGMIQRNNASYGGGTWVNITGNPLIQNCLITDGSSGSGLGEFLLHTEGQPSIINCTIVNEGSGHRLISTGQSDTYISNCIIWGPSYYLEPYSDKIIFANSIVNGRGGSANWNGPSRSDGGGNLDVDPLFVNPGGGDYRLLLSSPAINAGRNSLIADQSIPDLDGNPRVFGSNVDMGAYEIQTHRATSGTIHVDASVTTPGNGDSWATAIPSLAEAIRIAHESYVSVNKILVAEGTYYPEYKVGNGTTDRHKAFTITRNSLEILGGYPAGGNGDRNPNANPTILSGDIGVPDDNTDNAYHVVITVGPDADASLKLDGFTITDGNADGAQGERLTIGDYDEIRSARGGGWYNVFANPQLNAIKITGNRSGQLGGGVFNEGGSPTVTNTTISNNAAVGGAGWYNNLGSPIVTNAVIRGNSATGSGGGWSHYGGSATLQNVLITANTGGSGGGSAWHNSSGSPSLVNCTITGNSGGVTSIWSNNSSMNVSNSIVWGPNDMDFAENISEINYIKSIVRGSGGSIGWNHEAGHDNGGNLNLDPLFVNPDEGDYRLQLCSPAINAGNNSLMANQIVPDLGGNTRIIGAQVDMGAYEKQTELLPGNWGDNVALTGSSSNDLVLLGTACEDEGWTYYSAPDNNERFSFAIHWGSGNEIAKAAAQVNIRVAENNTTAFNDKKGFAAMRRYWNVNLNGSSLTNPVKVRFYYNSADTLALHSSVTDGGLIAKDNAVKWFKTIGGLYSPEQITATGINNGDWTALAVVYGEDNAVAYAQFDDVTSFSGGTAVILAEEANPMPITLLSFQARTSETGAHLLTWQTTDEKDFSHFEVEYSTDAKAFAYLATVKAQQDGNHKFIHLPGVIPLSYYRLRMVDTDGSFAYSKIVSLRDFKTGTSAGNLFPNPARGTNPSLYLTVAEAGDWEASVYTLTGVRLTHTTVVLKPGINQLTIDVKGFPPGIYLIRLNDNIQQEIFRKLVIE